MLTILLCAEVAAYCALPDFPLKLSANGRYLVDQNDKPFLIKEISAWGLIQSLSEADEAAFMDSVGSKGFNTLLVSVISYDTRFAGKPPDWNGISPFKVHWDFSTYDTVYFSHVDRVLNMAGKRGMVVLLVACYLGWSGDPNQGWWDELRDKNNSPDKSRIYGRFLGNRYKNFTNIIWVAGGDNDADGPSYEHMKNIIEGIKENDHHLWTAHWSANHWSFDNIPYASYLDLNGMYNWTERFLGSAGPQYRTELEKYGSGKMIFQLDQSYENDVSDTIDNLDHQWIRRKNYDGILCGCRGTSFSPGTIDNQCYIFKNWKPLMNTQGMWEAKYCFNLFESRSWQDLIPDSSCDVSGRGAFGDITYACAARTSTGGTMIVYIPTAREIMVDLGRISGKSVRAWWYSPGSGRGIKIGEYPTAGFQKFNPPAAGDWVLVIDDASLDLNGPGTAAAEGIRGE